jgi:hypothetical protein
MQGVTNYKPMYGFSGCQQKRYWTGMYLNQSGCFESSLLRLSIHSNILVKKAEEGLE